MQVERIWLGWSEGYFTVRTNGEQRNRWRYVSEGGLCLDADFLEKFVELISKEENWKKYDRVRENILKRISPAYLITWAQAELDRQTEATIKANYEGWDTTTEGFESYQLPWELR